MAPRKRQSNKRSNRPSAKGLPNVPASATVYRGPMVDMPSDDTSVVLFQNASISSDVTGAIAGTFNNNPSSCINWSEYSTSWGEYRVLGVRFTYMPQYSANTTALSGFSGYHGIVHGTTVYSPTTIADAASTGISRIWDPFRVFVRDWRMNGADEASWVSTNGPSATSNCLTVFGTNATVSTLYGNLLMSFVLQFRSHRK